LLFLRDLKRTGMPLQEIAEFTEDGCVLDRMQQGILPAQPVEKRLAILHRHEERLYEQRHQLEMLLEMVYQKIAIYEEYMERLSGKNRSEPEQRNSEHSISLSE